VDKNSIRKKDVCDDYFKVITWYQEVCLYHIALKLKSGYNIGIEIKKIRIIDSGILSNSQINQIINWIKDSIDSDKKNWA